MIVYLLRAANAIGKLRLEHWLVIGFLIIMLGSIAPIFIYLWPVAQWLVAQLPTGFVRDSTDLFMFSFLSEMLLGVLAWATLMQVLMFFTKRTVKSLIARRKP